MKVLLVTYFIIGVASPILAEQQINTNISDIKEADNLKLIDDDIFVNTKLQKLQRRKYLIHYSSKQKHLTNDEFNKHRYGGATSSKLQMNHPFKVYGPPNHENLKQEESPIASQNNQPFGQHTANYLPPKNQELPIYSPSNIFSNQNHDFPNRNNYKQQQQQYNFQQQQNQYEQQQKQQYDEQQQHRYQDQLHQYNLHQQKQFDQHHSQYNEQQKEYLNQQNYILQNVDNSDLNSAYNVLSNQQISDAALFLSENAEAISKLYGAPAANENYAPNNQNVESLQYNNEENRKLKSQVDNNYHLQHQNYFPSYAAGILSSEGSPSYEKVQSLERERLIADLKQALSNQQFPEFTKKNKPLKLNTEHNASFKNYQPFRSSTLASSLAGFTGSSTPNSLSTHISISPTLNRIIPNHSNGINLANTLIEANLPASDGLRPSIVNSVAGKFESGFIPTVNSIPSSSPYQLPILNDASVKSTSDSPTYFGIPIPVYKDILHPQSKVTAISPPKPSHGAYFNSAQSSIVQPNAFPVVSASAPLYPTYGIHSEALYPASVYHPVKTYPFSHYPNALYRQLQKPVGLSGSTNVWSYASSFARRR